METNTCPDLGLLLCVRADGVHMSFLIYRMCDAGVSVSGWPLARELEAKSTFLTFLGPTMMVCADELTPHPNAVVKVDRRIRWHYTTTILRLRIGARLTRYRNIVNFTISLALSAGTLMASAGILRTA